MQLHEVLAEVAERLVEGQVEEGGRIIDRIAHVPREAVPRRSIGIGTHARVWTRDSFLCGYCGRRVIPGRVLELISHFYPRQFPYHAHGKGAHIAYWTVLASTDHREAHSFGGSSEIDNLITACWACNQAKSNLTLEDAGMAVMRPTPDTAWRGLTERYPALIERLPEDLQRKHRAWSRAFETARA